MGSKPSKPSAGIPHLVHRDVRALVETIGNELQALLTPLFDKFDSEIGIVDPQGFRLDARTRVFFTNLAGYLTCKKQADALYREKVRSLTRILDRPEFRSMGPISRLKQEGGSFMPVEKVREEATKHKPAFDNLLRRIVLGLGLDPDREIRVNGKSIRKNGTNYRVVTTVDIKRFERCATKAEKEYGGNAIFLCDAGRATIVCQTEDEVAAVLRALQQDADAVVVRTKNRFANPIYTGVRDVMVNIEVNGHVFEIQIYQADMLALDTSSNAHRYYEYFREYFMGSAKTYKNRMELFHKLGDAVKLAPDVGDGIRGLLEENDIAQLRLLREIAKLLGESILELFVLQRL